LASRAREGGGKRRGGEGLGEEEPGGAFSLVLRVTVLSALLLLAVYTVLAFARGPAAAPREPLQRLAAERLAAQAAAVSSTLKLSAAAGAALPGGAGAAAALRLGAPFARAAALVRDGAVLSLAGDTAATSALRQAGAIRALEGHAWFGVPAQRGAPWVFAGAPLPGGGQIILAAPRTEVIGPGRTGDLTLLATQEGLVVAANGPTPLTTQAALGLDGPALRSAARSGEARGLFNPGRPAEVAVARTPDGALLAVSAAPAGSLITGPGGRVASNIFAMFAPLAMGLLLTLVLMVQTRKAEAAQRARRESERKFRTAVEAARCGIWEWDLLANRVSMSDVTGVMFGWGGGGLASGEDVIARIAPEHQDRVRQALRGAAEFGALDVSFCVPRATGGVSWIDARGQAFGEPASEGLAAPTRYGRVIGVALDVTEERTAEHRAQAAERRLRDAIDSVSEAFVLWDRYGRLLMCNQTFREVFSLEPRVLKPGATRSSVLKLAELAVRAHTPVANPARPGLREVETVDGRWLQISERRTAEGGLVMTAADITGVKRQEEARRLNEEALQNAVARLEESRRELSDLAQKYQAEKFRAEGANSAKSEFLANMSHELRTPLNAINGFSEMMVTEMFGPLGDRRYKEYAGDILTSGQHLLALINDILDMSKIEAGKMTLHLETVDVAELVEEAVRLMRNRAETAGLTVGVAIPDDLPTLEADFRGLKQILLNLLSNAIKFTPQGGRVTVKAKLTQGASGPGVRISVSDTGIGIAPEDMGRLAKPFEQIETQHSKTQQGTGLGLALTKSLVELHEGVLSIESEPGVGTTVSFVLPLRLAAAKGVAGKARLDLETAVALA
jgi:two-component system, cell cycle sensor histidine kinase PleC